MSTNENSIKWIRIFDPIHIPKYLIEQVKNRQFKVDDFYIHQKNHCLIKDDKGEMKINPFNYLYVLVNEDNIVKGFLWFVVEPLSKFIFINTYSVDKEEWGNGKAMKWAVDHVKEIMSKIKFNKAYWLTRYPRHSEKHGFKRSRDVMMEFNLEEDVKGE